MKADPPIMMYINGVTARPTLISRVGLAEDVRIGAGIPPDGAPSMPSHGGPPMTLHEIMIAEGVGCYQCGPKEIAEGRCLCLRNKANALNGDPT